MQRFICDNCKNEFSITQQDAAFCAKLDVPLPTGCPDCRQQLRLRQINQLKLFRRNCDATGKSIVSSHPPYVPYPVYTEAYWYSDAVDNTTFGSDIDFTRPFFDQFFGLSCKVPRPAVCTDFSRDENSEYTNYAGMSKNCYLIFDSDCNWDCMYSYSLNGCKNTVDCYRGDTLELCHECIDCKECYASSNLQDCQVCSDSMYLKNCIGVKNSLFSVNLHQKVNYLFNQQSTQEEIADVKKSLADDATLNRLIERYRSLVLSLPERAFKGVQNENCVGNYLTNCKNAYYCFDSREIWDGAYLYQVFMSLKDSMDCFECGKGELIYQCADLGYSAFNCSFSMNSLEQLSHLMYCNFCFLGCHHLFGCIGLKKKTYCILNKQYTEKQYKELAPKLKAHMKETGEWGQFFPERLSHFAYNHTHANICYPLSEGEASFLKKWWVPDEKPPDAKPGANLNLCRDCNAPFKLVKEEIEFYAQTGFTVPQKCFLCRHQARLEKRSHRLLVEMTCDKCHKVMQAPFNKTKQQLYCDTCFQDARF